MPCYEPMVLARNLSKWETRKDGKRYHPVSFVRKAKDWNENMRTPYNEYFLGPCKQCIGCQLDKAQEWATRGYLESLYWENNWFATFTYDEENLPKYEYEPDVIETRRSHVTFTRQECEEKGYQWHYCTNRPDDITKLLHDIRQSISRKYKIQEKIRFMACEEYGSQFQRTHLHVIFFNLNLPLWSFYKPRIDWKKDIYYKNTILEKCWNKGLVEVGKANYDTMAYVARYATKKILATCEAEEYAKHGMHKEIFRSSRNPGIGYQYYQDHKEEIYENDKVLVKTKKGGEYRTPPEYYDIMYELENPEKMKKIKEKRQRKMINSLLLKEKTTSLTYEEQLQVELAYKEQQISCLTRDTANDAQLGFIRRRI